MNNDFMFAFRHTQPLLKRNLLEKKKNELDLEGRKRILFPFRVDIL